MGAAITSVIFVQSQNLSDDLIAGLCELAHLIVVQDVLYDDKTIATKQSDGTFDVGGL